MKRQNKEKLLSEIEEDLSNSSYFYIADTSSLSVNETNKLRKQCYEQGVKLRVVKNTLMKKALEAHNINDQELVDSLTGPSSLMLTENINAPAKIISDFRKTHDMPLLKAAYIEDAVYVGDDQLEPLTELKSKEDLIGDIVALLNAPVKNVVSSLQSGSHKLAGLVKTLSEREEQ